MGLSHLNRIIVLALFIIGPGVWHAEADGFSQQIVKNNARFALDLYQQLAAEKGNLFFSPFSISSALAMTSAGARANTASQMAAVLNFTGNPVKFHQTFGELMTRLTAVQAEKAMELRIANALWAQKGYRFLEEFVRILRQSYRAELYETDFKSAAEAARNAINGWVERQTEQKIKDLIQPGVLDALSRLVLINAIYFKGLWDSPFDADTTREMAFQVFSDERVMVPMMHQTHELGYLENDRLQVLELPYQSNAVSMMVLLPKMVDGLADLESTLTIDHLSEWFRQLRQCNVSVYFPKFKIGSEFSLKQVLIKLGITDAFDPAQADFSGMTGRKELFLTAVVHQALVEVTEEGTEAAAATGTVIGITAIAPPAPVFKADHPFMFIIRDNTSGSILFWGRVTHP